MGVVYEAHDTIIGREVAIKVLSRDMSQDFDALRRFMVEAQAAGKHPNSVAIDVEVEGRSERLRLGSGGHNTEDMMRQMRLLFCISQMTYAHHPTRRRSI